MTGTYCATDTCGAKLKPTAYALATQSSCAKQEREGVFTSGDARSFSPWADVKIPPLVSMLNFDADVKKSDHASPM